MARRFLNALRCATMLLIGTLFGSRVRDQFEDIIESSNLPRTTSEIHQVDGVRPHSRSARALLLSCPLQQFLKLSSCLLVRYPLPFLLYAAQLRSSLHVKDGNGTHRKFQ